MFGRNYCLVVGRAVLLAPIGLVLGGCYHLGVALHLDTDSQVSRAAPEVLQTEWGWRYKLEQSHPLGNPHLLAYADSEDVLVG